MSLVHVKSNTVGNATGTVTVWNTQGSTTTAPASALVQPQDWNSQHQMTQLFSGNTLGSSSVSGTDLVWAAGNNIQLSASQGAGIATVSIGQQPMTNFMPREAAASLTAIGLFNPGQSSNQGWFVPIQVPAPVAFDAIRAWDLNSWVSSNIAFSQSATRQWGLYSNNAGTLSLISSGSYTFHATGSSGSATMSYPASSNSAGYTYSSATFTGTQIQQSFGNFYTRVMDHVFGAPMTLQPGQYWFAYQQVYSSSGANGGLSHNGVANVNNLFSLAAGFGQNSRSTQNQQPYLGVGQAGAALSASLPSSVALSSFGGPGYVPLVALIST